MDGSEAGSGRSGGGPPQGVIAAVVVLVAMLVIGVAVAIGIRLGGSDLGEQTATGPVTTSTKTTTTRTSRPSRTRTSTTATTPRRVSAVCDPRVINADLGYPDSGARIIDCGGGWAVMASEYSGDPFWVSFQGGRWQAERDISMYLSTCPDTAIARGAPAWMADKHLTCQSLTASTPTTRSSSTRPPATNPGVSPSARPTTPTSPGTSEPSSPTSSPSATSEETTTTTPPADPTPVAAA